MQEKPASVPEGATWDAGDNEWVLAERDSEGELHGLVKYYRPDGTLCCETEFSHGTPHGDFCRFHENGEPSRRGVFVDGQLHGTNVFTRSSGETSESFPHDGGGKAFYCEMDYEMGAIKDARLYDHDRKRIMEDGEPFPEQRPEGVPERATFRKSEIDSEYCWVVGEVRDNNDGTIDRLGTWRYFRPEGVLKREIPYVDGKRQGIERSYDDEGELACETPYEDDEKHGTERTFGATGAILSELPFVQGKKHGVERSFDEEGTLLAELSYDNDKKLGPYRRRVDEGDMADASIRFERGQYGEREAPVGPTQWLDTAEQIVAEIDRGDASDNDVMMEVLEATPDTDFAALAATIKEKRQHVAWLLALVRALPRGGSLDAVKQAITAMRPPLSDDHADGLFDYTNQVAHQVMRFGGPMMGTCNLLGSITLGTPAPDVLRRAAALLDDYADSRVASELIDAAIALAPERKEFEFTRALISMSLGDPKKAAACVAALREHDEDQADGMACYLAALYPRYDYWRRDDERARVALEAPPDEELSLMRSIDDFKWLIQACATRIELLRDALIEQLEGQTTEWLVPTLPQLLPDGRVELTEIEQVDREGGLVRLNHRVRAEWDRLCWACWLAGLDELSLPGAESEPRDLQRFVAMFRSWRWIAEGHAHHGGVEPEDDVDRRLLASHWFGSPVEKLWNAVADFITKDNAEMLQTLLWLANSEVPTPFVFEQDE